MVRGLLDTNLLIADDVPPIEGELAISVVSLAELHFGVLVAREATQRALRLQRLAAVESRFTPLPVDGSVARHYGQLAAHVRGSGRNPRARAFDLVIAATAIAHGAALYTRNQADFAGVADLVDVRPV
ncbi:MAG: type II toxin-antitoxin system VapC family toxin [Actinomycetota bacterium]|nr:type II toxin-antitoxin system VapC family toxin [Nocardioidaceae bacterium]MDQ3480166.1 type II toxin-antitoxin system VapC family toxin [Actinomycetota bacterium]